MHENHEEQPHLVICKTITPDEGLWSGLLGLPTGWLSMFRTLLVYASFDLGCHCWHIVFSRVVVSVWKNTNHVFLHSCSMLLVMVVAGDFIPTIGIFVHFLLFAKSSLWSWTVFFMMMGLFMVIWIQSGPLVKERESTLYTVYGTRVALLWLCTWIFTTKNNVEVELTFWRSATLAENADHSQWSRKRQREGWSDWSTNHDKLWRQCHEYRSFCFVEHDWVQYVP